MFDILSDSTITITSACIKEANSGYVPYDLLVGGTSTMLNIEKGTHHTHTMAVKSLYHLKPKEEPPSLLRRRYSRRVAGRSILKDTPSVFEPGTLAKIPETTAKGAIRGLAKLFAYAQANGEEIDLAMKAILSVYGLPHDFKVLIPTTDSKRTKPWALDDAPKSRHINGMYNTMQNVSVSLGNYQSGVNVGGKMVDYDRVVTLLRSVGALVFGHEEWLEDAVLGKEYTLKYHLNLSEFPNVSKGRFLTKYLVAVAKNLSGSINSESETFSVLQSTHKAAMDYASTAGHLVPITIMDPNVKTAIADLLSTTTERRLFLPTLHSSMTHDIEVELSSQSSFSLLPKPSSDKVARSPRNAMHRVLTPWLRVVMGKEDWPHTVARCMQSGDRPHAAEILLRELDPRIPRLMFRIVSVHTPIEWNVWKLLLRWLFPDPRTIPAVNIHDPWGAVKAALRQHSMPMLHTFLSSYNAALQSVSHFSHRDLLVSTDKSALDSLLAMQQSLYKRVAKAYGKRYYTTATLLADEYKRLKSAQTRTKYTTYSVPLVQLRKRLVKYQWRCKIYPKLLPVAEDNLRFSDGVYLATLKDMIGNYYRKRGGNGTLARVDEVINQHTSTGRSLIETIGELARVTKLDLVTQYKDILHVREQTIDDINTFVRYDTTLHVDHDDMKMADYDYLYDDVEMPLDNEFLEFDMSDQQSVDVFSEPSDAVDLSQFFTDARAIEDLVVVDNVYWADELDEAGYGAVWANEAAKKFDLQLNTSIPYNQYLEVEAWVKDQYTPQFLHTATVTQPTLLDIV